MNKKLTDVQIEMIADLFSKREARLLHKDVVENPEQWQDWLLSHAFQIGAKFARDFIDA